MEHDGKKYRELRCTCCRALLCYEHIVAGEVLIDCPRCKERNVFTFKGARGELLKYEYKKRREVKTHG